MSDMIRLSASPNVENGANGFDLAPEVQSNPLTFGSCNHFFGYFDKSPWNLADPNDIRVLCHASQALAIPSEPGHEIGVGYFEGNSWAEIAKTSTWNYQQGAMLQWVPGVKNQVAFNVLYDSVPNGCVFDLTSGAKRLLSLPIAAIAPNGNLALSINFGRLNRVRPDYGYSEAKDKWADIPLPKDDGIWRVDMRSGNAELIISLGQIASYHCPDGDKSYHWVNHSHFNPSGDRFCFIHRYVNSAGSVTSRLFTLGVDGKDLRLLITGMASHATWLSHDRLLAWAGKRALVSKSSRGIAGRLPIGRMLKWLYRALGKPSGLKSKLMHDRYVMFHDDDGTMEEFGKGLFWCDGHASFSPDRRWMATDTYPDRKRRTSLLLYEVGTGKVIEVAKFWSPPELEDEVRCDLHPRWHPDGTKICVDSAHAGTRQMYQLDVSAIVG